LHTLDDLAPLDVARLAGSRERPCAALRRAATIDRVSLLIRDEIVAINPVARIPDASFCWALHDRHLPGLRLPWPKGRARTRAFSEAENEPPFHQKNTA